MVESESKRYNIFILPWNVRPNDKPKAQSRLFSKQLRPKSVCRQLHRFASNPMFGPRVESSSTPRDSTLPLNIPSQPFGSFNLAMPCFRKNKNTNTWKRNRKSSTLVFSRPHSLDLLDVPWNPRINQLQSYAATLTYTSMNCYSIIITCYRQ